MKRSMFFLVIMCILTLTGCSSYPKIIEEAVIRISGVEDNEDYQQAQKLQTEGKLNFAGEDIRLDEYQMEDAEEQKQVHVTIANNDFLEIDYFMDSEREEKIEDTSFYLNPGEKLYCSQPDSANDYNSAYVFSKFQVYEFDANGNRGKLFAETGEDSLVLEIPQDYEGTELAIFPVGEYEKRGLTFHAFYHDGNGNEKIVPGEWSVNDVVYFEDEVEIDVNGEYTVKYKYDKDTYYYVNAKPAPFSTESPGLVEFKKTDDERNYSVELHQYVAIDFSYDNNKKAGIESVSVNGSNLDLGDTISDLKVGDYITITTNEDYRVYCPDIEMDDEELDNGFRYTFRIPETDKKKFDFKIFKSGLEIVLNESVGVDTLFDITGCGINEKDLHYASGKKNLSIFDGSMGIGERLSIAAKGKKIDEGSTLKIEVKMEDGNEEETEEIKYLQELPGTVDIDLYDEMEELVNLDKIYKEMSIEISLVPGNLYFERTIENGTISLKKVGNVGESLTSGDIVEPSEKVEVSIIPDDGYYVSGKGVDNQQYIKTMKFSAYSSDIDTIIKEHEIKKLYQVVVDTADDYGVCVYKLNGEEITEKKTISIQEDDELLLEYELTNLDYEITRESDGFWGGILDWGKSVFSKTKETVEIQIESGIDGKTIKRDDYINIIKKGE